MSDKHVKHEYNITSQQVNIFSGDGSISVSGAPQSVQSSVQPTGKLKANLFISYRRAASEDFAHMLHGELLPYIDGEVFLDSANLGNGKFADQLEAKIAACDFFLPLISKGTFDRAHEPEDWVRREIEVALREKRQIIPVLRGDTPFPLPNELPASLRALLDWNAVRFDLHDRSASTRRVVERFLRTDSK